MTAPLQDQHKCVALIISCRKYLYTRAAKQDTSALPFDFKYFIGEDPSSNLALPLNTIELPCNDSYESLPHKVNEAIKWAKANLNFDYILKTDDDTVFNAPAIRDVFSIVTSRQVDYAGSFSRSKLPLYSYSHLGSCEDPILRCIPMLGPRSPYASGGAYFLSARAVDAYLDVYSSIPDHLIYEDGVMGECLSASSIFKDIVVQPFPPDEYRKAFFWDDE